MERELFLSRRSGAHIEKRSAEIANKFGLEIEDVRRRIREKIFPHPPLQQCKDAANRVEAECAAAAPAKESGQDA